MSSNDNEIKEIFLMILDNIIKLHSNECERFLIMLLWRSHYYLIKQKNKVVGGWLQGAVKLLLEDCKISSANAIHGVVQCIQYS